MQQETSEMPGLISGQQLLTWTNQRITVCHIYQNELNIFFQRSLPLTHYSWKLNGYRT